MSESKPKPWVDGPFELLSSDLTGHSKAKPATGVRHVASEMVSVHNLLLRGINAVYLQCVNVATHGTSKDKADFAHFSLQWGKLIEEHHGSEEAAIFPDINRIVGVPGFMDANIDEHALFHDGLAAYMTYLEAVVNGEERYDGEKLRGLIDSFMPVLREHLKNEIGTLLALEKYEDKTDWAKWFETLVGGLMKKQSATSEYRNEMLAMPFIFHDKTFESGAWESFPPVPWIVGLVFRWFFLSTHADWWRFAGSGFDSMPRELPFA